MYEELQYMCNYIHRSFDSKHDFPKFCGPLELHVKENFSDYLLKKLKSKFCSGTNFPLKRGFCTFSVCPHFNVNLGLFQLPYQKQTWQGDSFNS